MRTTEIWKDGKLIESIRYTAEEETAADALKAQELRKAIAPTTLTLALANLQAAIAAIGKSYSQGQIQAAFNAVLAALQAQQQVTLAFTPEMETGLIR